MRPLFLGIGMLLTCEATFSQSFIFEYDAGGNRIRRSADGALPVELAFFRASLEDGYVVRLTWQSVTEKDFSHYEAERSLDAAYWTTVGVVKAREGEGNTVPYYLIDSYPGSGMNYYRLKMVDDDGTHAYSTIESVYLTRELMVYPNPGSEYLIVSDSTEIERFEIVAVDGKMVGQGKLSQTGQLDIREQPGGVYLLKLYSAKGAVKVVRFIKK